MFQHQKWNNFKAACASLIKTHQIAISARNHFYIVYLSLLSWLHLVLDSVPLHLAGV